MNNLKKENIILKKKLEIAQKWMKREVLSDLKNIKTSKLNLEIKSQKQDFFSENIPQIAYNQVVNFFWEEIFLYISKDILENIVSSEILFFTFFENKNIDWLGIITSYHKSFDLIIEENITKPFRKFFNNKKINLELKNDLLEKNIYSVIFKGHILWFWKFYFLLKNISENNDLLPYASVFKEFLEKYFYIKKIVLEKEFLEIYEKLLALETFWKKRHIWKVDFDDVIQTRKYFLWDLVDKNSFLFKLLKIYEN